MACGTKPISPSTSDRPLLHRLQAEKAAQQRGLAAAVAAENREQLAAPERERDVAEDPASAEGDAGLLDPDHCRHPAVWVRTRSIAKTGAPMIAVMIPSGISAAVAVRATSSTASM